MLHFEVSNFPSSKESSANSSPCTGNKSGSGKKFGICGLATELIQVTRFKQNNITAAREVKNKIKERYKSLRQAHMKNFPLNHGNGCIMYLHQRLDMLSAESVMLMYKISRTSTCH